MNDAPHKNDSAHIQLKEVSVRFPRPDGIIAETALEGLNLQIERGESLAITGPSGSGKTTTLNVIAGLLVPDEGAVLVDGRAVHELSANDRANFRREHVGFIFQNHRLLPHLTAIENVLIPYVGVRLTKRERDALFERATQLLTRMQLGNRVDHCPGQLSLGQCQRVAVARAVIRTPKLLLADEPTGSLDQEHAKELVELLLEHKEEHKTTLILVTHDQEIAQRMDRRHELVTPKTPAQ